MPPDEAQGVSGRAAVVPDSSSTLKMNSSGGYDSGYASTETTPEDKSQQRVCTEGVTVASRSLFRSKVTKLTVFQKEIPRHVYHRFYDLLELFSGPLYQYLRDKGVTPRAISIKLKALGESEALAKPWIVVMTDEKASKHARQFFKSPEIKDQYQPDSEDPLCPSFDVIVCNLPPRRVASGKSPVHRSSVPTSASSTLTKVYGHPSDLDTVCGSIVRVGEQAHGLVATLGGIIKIERFDGTYALYAMTASHVVTPDQREEVDHSSVTSWEDPEIEDEEFILDEEEFRLEGWPNTTHDESRLSNDSGISPDPSPPIDQNPWWTIGRMAWTSQVEESDKPDLDWALVAFHDPFLYRPNSLSLPDAQGQASQISFSAETESIIGSDTLERPVYLLGGPSGVKRGVLSSTWSYLMISPSHKLAKHFSLLLSDGSAVKAGDCGSWVVSEAKHEVLGHVVASDILGEAYVVPIHAIFQDIKEKLSAKAVSVSSASDFRHWLKMCTPWLQDHPIDVASSQDSQNLTDKEEAAGVTNKEATSLQSALSGPLNINNAARIEGFELTKLRGNIGEKSTWKFVCRTPMQVSQKAMMNLVTEAEKNGTSAEKKLDDPEMKGHKRSQISRLLEDLSEDISSPSCRLGYLNLVKNSKGRTKAMEAIILTDASRLFSGQKSEIVNLTESDRSKRRHHQVLSTDSAYSSPNPPLAELSDQRASYELMYPHLQRAIPAPTPLPMETTVRPLLPRLSLFDSESARPRRDPNRTIPILKRSSTGTYLERKGNKIPPNRVVYPREVELSVSPPRRHRKHWENYWCDSDIESEADSNVATDGEGEESSKVKAMPAPSKRKVEPTPKAKVVQFDHATTKRAPKVELDPDTDSDASLISDIFSTAGTETTRGTGFSAESSNNLSKGSTTGSQKKKSIEENTERDHEVISRYGEHRRPDSKTSYPTIYHNENVKIIPASTRDRRPATYYRTRSPEPIYRRYPRTRSRSVDPWDDDDNEHNSEPDLRRVPRYL